MTCLFFSLSRKHVNPMVGNLADLEGKNRTVGYSLYKTNKVLFGTREFPQIAMGIELFL